tara:strand:+ start:11211 stop:11426 length:216 start_codon:yes stop_codon:yes gene_type:complete
MTVVQESNLRICKTCNKIKTRITAGKFPNGKDKKHVDENGKQWTGSVCPDCLKEKSKLHSAKVRAAKKETA